MRSTEQLDLIGAHEMTFDEFERHCVMCCVRPLDGSMGLRVESLDAPGYVGADELRRELKRSFDAQGLEKAVADQMTDDLAHELISEGFTGSAWHVRMERGKTIILVKADAAIEFTARAVTRSVYSDAAAEAAREHGSRREWAAGGAHETGVLQA